MNMLIETLQRASANPWSWGVVALIGAVAMFYLYQWRTCPYLCHRRQITPEESAVQLDQPFVAGPRFVVVMLAGIASVLAGLAMVSYEANPPLALLLIVLGVFAVKTEPALLQLRESVNRVVAAQLQGPEAVSAAEERLNSAHLWMVATNFLILFAAIAALLAF